MLTYTGQLQGKRVSSYQGKDKTQLQFLEKREDGSLGFLEVKVPDGMDPEQFRTGQNVTVPVEYKLVRDKIYWAVSKEAPSTGTKTAA